MKATRKVKVSGKKVELRIEYEDLEVLESWPGNPKLHDVEGIANSIRRFGFAAPIVIDETSRRIVAGHGRREALSKIRLASEPAPKNVKVEGDRWLVPVVRGNEFASEEEAERYLLADNRFVELGGWDPELLIGMIGKFGDEDLASVGFDREEVDRISRLASEGVEAPTEFVSFNASSVPTTHECPKCGFKWS